MEFTTPVIYIESLVYDQTKHRAVEAVLRELRRKLSVKTPLSDLKRINALKDHGERYFMTPQRFVQMAHYGHDSKADVWLEEHPQTVASTVDVLKAFGVKVDIVLTQEIAHGLACIYMPEVIPEDKRDGTGPLMKLMGKYLFCSPQFLSVVPLYTALESQTATLEISTHLSALEGKYVNNQIHGIIRQYFATVAKKATGRFLEKLIDGYVPVNDDEDRVFMVDGSYNGKYEYLHSLYYAFHGVKWLDFWNKSEFKLKISKNF